MLTFNFVHAPLIFHFYIEPARSVKAPGAAAPMARLVRILPDAREKKIKKQRQHTGPIRHGMCHTTSLAERST